MSAIELLRKLKQEGINLAVNNGKLVIKAEKGKLTPQLLSEIKAQKEALITLLLSSQEVSQSIKLPELQVHKEHKEHEESVLSYGQKRLWLLDKLQMGSSQYNMVTAFKMEGDVDASVFERAIKKLLIRQQVLRTCIIEVEGQPAAQLIPSENFILKTCAVTKQNVPLRMKEFFSYSFDLASDYMIQVQLLSVSSKEHILLINIHHIACDGWSLDIFNDELVALYHAEIAGKAAHILPLEFQYSDYAHWQKALLTADTHQELLDYWQQRLSSAPYCHSLSLDKTRPVIFDPRGDKVVCPIPAPLLSDIELYCKKIGVSLNHFMKAAFGLLLQKFSNETDIVIGSPVANRPLKSMEAMIGFFINTLPFVYDFNHEGSVEDLILKVKQQELSDIEHQHLPFDVMVEKLSPKRDLSLSPIFQIVFAMQNYQVSKREVAGLKMELIAPEVVQAKYDLSLYIYAQESGAEAHFDYATSLFDRETIFSMSQSYLTLLASMTASPLQPWTDLTLVSDKMCGVINSIGKGAPVNNEFSNMQNVLDILQRSQQLYPTHNAFSNGKTSLSYSELMGAIANCQYDLKMLGISLGDRVALAAPKTAELFITSFAIMGLGAVYVPIDIDLPDERIQYILRDSQPNLVIASDDFIQRDLVGDLLGDQKQFPFSKLNTTTDSKEQCIHHFKKSDPAYIIYTSGTTGNPKGVVICHQGLFALANTVLDKKYASPLVRGLQFSNMCFDGNVLEWLTALTDGGCLFLMPSHSTKDPAFVQQFIIDNNINFAVLPPSYLMYLDHQALGCLTTLCTGGDKIDLPMATKWQAGRRYLNVYGPTETTVIVSIAEYNNTPEYISIGTPLIGNTFLVVDENLKAVPLKCPGELLIASEGIALEYLNLPELTADKFITLSDGIKYYRSGDLVKQKTNGEIIVLGRNDRQVKVRGFRIELGEIEAKLLAVKGVSLACVNMYEQASGTIIVGYCEITNDTLNGGLIRDALKQSLPEYMLPATVEICQKIPITHNSKIDYKALTQPVFTATAVATELCGQTELQLQDIWSNILGHAEFGATDSFFDVGGHSLLLTNLLNEIEKVWKLKLPMQQVFQHADIRHIAVLIDTLLPEHTSDLENSDTEQSDMETEMEGGFL